MKDVKIVVRGEPDQLRAAEIAKQIAQGLSRPVSRRVLPLAELDATLAKFANQPTAQKREVARTTQRARKPSDTHVHRAADFIGYFLDAVTPVEASLLDVQYEREKQEREALHRNQTQPQYSWEGPSLAGLFNTSSSGVSSAARRISSIQQALIHPHHNNQTNKAMARTAILKPIGKKVLVIMDSRKAVSEGGIHIPEKSQRTSAWGEVCEVSDDVNEEIKIGDRVYVESHLGTHYIFEGVDYIILPERNVQLIERETP